VKGKYDTLRGVGLGLSIVKQLIEKMDGKIWIESEIEKGSIFYFSFPYQKSIKSPSIIKDKPVLLNPKAKLALVAEDDDGNFYLTKLILKRMGIKVLRAENGQKAVEICNTNTNIDFVLMDLKMPIMDGLEATLKIRESKKDLLIFAISAHVMEDAKTSALNAGCNDFISKPIDEDKLLSLIS
jgi:CheY-like chemotaxis protein